MYEFIGRTLNIGNDLLAEYEKLMYGPLTDVEICAYIYREYKIDPIKEPEKLANISDEELRKAIVEFMEREMEFMR